MMIQKNIQMKFACVIVFLIMDFNVSKVKKFWRVIFCSRTFDNHKINYSRKGHRFGSDIFILCCDHIFHRFDDLIDQEFVDSVDEIDDCQKVIHVNNLLAMNEPPPTRCERFSSDVIYFHEICDNCKKHYIKKISLKLDRIKI